MTDVRGWAAGFPKVKPLPPPHTRVMTLLQANVEAVARHYRRPDALPVATAITAYLTALGADLPVSPGMSPGQPVFPERIRQLRDRALKRLYRRREAMMGRLLEEYRAALEFRDRRAEESLAHMHPGAGGAETVARR